MKDLSMKIKSVHNEIFIFDLCKMFKTMNISFKALNIYSPRAKDGNPSPNVFLWHLNILEA